jgi:hypothetical protein
VRDRAHTTRLLAAGLAIAALAAACNPPRSSPFVAPPTPPPAPTGEASTSVDPTAAGGVEVDPTLLGVLPVRIRDIELTPDPDTAAEIASDGSIAPFVSAVAIASAFGPAATDTPLDYVVATVSRLRPGTFDDIFFRGWRDTFDAAVCEQSGGVEGNAETEIAGRQTFIGTCAGGVHTYHVYLPARDVIVSAHSAGEADFGEELIAGLAE